MTWRVGRFERLPLGAKISVTAMIGCGVALAIVAALHIAMDIYDVRPRLEVESRRLAQVVAANLSAAVAVGDIAAVHESLQAFALIPEIHLAEVRDNDGGVLASYSASGDFEFDPRSGGEHADRFRIGEPVMLLGERIGSLDLVVGRDMLDAAIRNYLIVAGLALILSLFPATAVVHIMKPAVLKPLARLSETMDRIAATQDYAARVEKLADDEFGWLAERFNAMLGEIERRDRSLASLAEEMTAAKDLAESANATKTKFIANMSHELRTPLNAIIGYAEMVIEDLEETGHHNQIADLRRIHAAALHLLGMINEVLDIAKIEAGKLELHVLPLNIAPLLREAADAVRPAAIASGNRLVVALAEDLGQARVDETRFRQCLLNLLGNACKFTRDGQVTLRAFVERGEGGPVLCVEVEDTGIGIPRDRIGALFEPFVQVDSSMTRRHGGTGLGLAITRDLVELMRGSITVASSPGAGSTFSIRIPAVASEQKPPRGPRGMSEIGPAVACRVLVIADPRNSGMQVERWLGPAGLRVATVATGAEGIAAVRRQRPELVILDADLPDTTGWSVLDELRALPGGRALPIIVVTGAGERARALAAGAWEQVARPVRRSRLLELVRAHVAPPPVRVLLRAAQGREAALRQVIETVGHRVVGANALGDEPTDCAVIDAALVSGPDRTDWSRINPGAGPHPRCIFWCGGSPGGAVPLVAGANAPVMAGSYAELLVAILRFSQHRESRHA